MKKGNFRTARIYPEKGKTKYVIEARSKGIWKILRIGNKQLIFDNEEDAVSLISIFPKFVKYFSVSINKHGVDVENLTTRA